MDEPSSSSSSSIILSRSPAIDRHNPIIRDTRRSIPSPANPPPRIANKKKNHNNTTNNNNQRIIQPKENSIDRGKESAKNKKHYDDDENVKIIDAGVRKNSWSCTKPSDFISPPGSTRYLLNEKVLFDSLPDFDQTWNYFPDENSKSRVVKAKGSGDIAKSPASSPVGFTNQVVVLRVSLHCRGCERKMREHISRMEGVTSFNIDFAAKMVTVTGNITPLEVLSSISKVKNAQIWSPNLLSSTQSALSLMSNSEIKNEYKGTGG